MMIVARNGSASLGNSLKSDSYRGTAFAAFPASQAASAADSSSPAVFKSLIGKWFSAINADGFADAIIANERPAAISSSFLTVRSPLYF